MNSTGQALALLAYEAGLWRPDIRRPVGSARLDCGPTAIALQALLMVDDTVGSPAPELRCGGARREPNHWAIAHWAWASRKGGQS